MRRHLPPRDWKRDVSDILQCILDIRRFTKGYTFDEFLRDKDTITSVTHNLETVAQVIHHIPWEIRARHAGVPWANMAAMKNIAKETSCPDQVARLWITIQEDLPYLIPFLNHARQEE